MRIKSVCVAAAVAVSSFIGGCAADVAPSSGGDDVAIEAPATATGVRGNGSSGSPYGKSSTLMLRAYRAFGAMLYKANRGGVRTLDISCSGGTFTTSSGNGDTRRLTDIFNGIGNAQSQKLTLCQTLSQMRTAYANAANELNNTADVYLNSSTFAIAAPTAQGAPADGAWVTDEETGRVYKTTRDELRWRFKGVLWQNAASIVQQNMSTIAHDLMTGADWGENVIDHMNPNTFPACNCSDGYAYTTFDPPNEGNTPSSIGGSVAGSASIVAVNGMGCMPAGTPLNQACVLAPFDGAFPNYVTSSQTLNSVLYPSFRTMSSSRCGGAPKCVMQ